MIAARSEPLVVRGATEDWAASDHWASSSKLNALYGDVSFQLAADCNPTLRDFLEYAAETTADFPYYIAERGFSGERGQVASKHANERAVVSPPQPASRI